jgi:hypothetical protein
MPAIGLEIIINIAIKVNVYGDVTSLPCDVDVRVLLLCKCRALVHTCEPSKLGEHGFYIELH